MRKLGLAFLTAILVATVARAEKPIFPIGIVDYTGYPQVVAPRIIDNASMVITARPDYWPNSKTYRYWTISDTRTLIEQVGREEALYHVQRSTSQMRMETGDKYCIILGGYPVPVYWSTAPASEFTSDGGLDYDYVTREWDRYSVSLSEPETQNYLLNIFDTYDNGWHGIFFDNATNKLYNVNPVSDNYVVNPPNSALNSTRDIQLRNDGMQSISMLRGHGDIWNGKGDGNRPSMFEYHGADPLRNPGLIPLANRTGRFQIPNPTKLRNDFEGVVAYHVCNAYIRQQIPHAVHLGNYGWENDGWDWATLWNDNRLWTADTSTVNILVDDNNRMAVRLGNKVYATNIADGDWWSSNPGTDWASPWGTIRAGSGIIIDGGSELPVEAWREPMSRALMIIRIGIASLQTAKNLDMPNGQYFFDEIMAWQDSLSKLEN